MTSRQDLYPSRYGEAARFIERQDPVVHGESARNSGPLSPEQLDQYARDGFLFLSGFFDPAEIEYYRQQLEAWRHTDKRNEPGVVVERDSQEVRSVYGIHQLDDVFGYLSQDARLVDMAAQILGSDVYIHQSRINYKTGFGGGDFYWHSDFETWHVEDGMPRMRAVSFSILLEDNNAFNGPLMLVPGSHKVFVVCEGTTPENHHESSLQKQDLGIPDPESLRRLADQGGIQAPTGPAGSVLLFDCNTLHGSATNISPWPRSNAFFCYNSIHNALQAPFGGLNPRPEYLACRKPAAIRPQPERVAAVGGGGAVRQ